MAEHAKLVISVDSRQAKSAEESLKRLTSSAGDAEKKVNDFGRRGAESAKQISQVTSSVNALSAAIRNVTIGLSAGFGLAEIAKASDAWTNFQNRLRLVTESQGQLTAASGEVYRIAQLTSQALDSTATVYQRFAQNSDKLGLSQQQLSRITETVSKAIAVSGASAASADAALVQFGQALASGVLRGEEFNSVAEQAPALLSALADGLGVTNAQLRAMANEGKLTADVLVKSLGNAASTVDEQFGTRVKTIAAATVELDNAFTKLVGTLSTTQGVGAGLASAISGLGSVLDGLSENAEVLGKALDVALAMAAGKALAALVGMGDGAIKAAAANRAAAVAAAQNAVADEGVAVAAQRAAAAELQAATAAVAKARADVAATAAEARRTAALAAASVGLSTQASLEAAATAAATAHSAAEVRLSATLEARTIAAGRAAATTQALTMASAASATASTAAAGATSVLAAGMTGLFGIGSRLIGSLGGPVGIIATLALTALAFIDFGDDAEKGMDKAAEATESAAKRVRIATGNILSDMNLGNVKTATFDQITTGVETLEEQVKQAEKQVAQLQAVADNEIPFPGFDPAALEQAKENVKPLTAALNQLKAELNDSRFSSQKWAAEYLQSLQKQSLEIADATDREKALLDMRLKGIDATSEAGQKILAQADANDKEKAAKEAATKAEQEATKAKNAGASASKQAAKELSDYRAEIELATATAAKQAAAYRQGEAAVAQLARQEEIERQVLKLGEQARADVTQRVNEYYDAVERRDLSKQTHELSREVDQLQAQAVATLAGRDALDEYNDAKALAIALSGKNVDAQSAEAKALEEAIQKNRKSARVLEQVSQANGIMDRLLPETRLLREYTEGQEALNKAIELYPEKADQYREALRRLGVEYEQNRTESSAWGKWTQDALERVDDAFADMWKGVGDGFGSFADGLKSAFSQLLAELAHMAITRPIIVQIGSALGIGGLAGQSAGIWGSLFGSSDSSGGSGSGLLGSLSNAYSLYQAGTGEGLLGSVVSGFREGGLSGAWEGLGDYGGGLSNAVASLFSGGAGVNSMAMGASQAGYTGAAFNSWVGTQNLANTLQGVATWAGPLAGAFAGYQAGGLGGAAVGGLGAWGGGLAGAAIGEAIGGTLGSFAGPIGSALGAAIGGWAAGKLFGGSGERFKETYTTSSGYYDYGSGYVDTGDLPVFSGRRQFGDDYDAYLSDVNERFVATVGGLYDTFTDGTAYVQSDIAARLRRTSGKIAADLWANVDAEPMHFKRSYGGDGKNIPGALEAFANDVMGEWLAQTIVNSDDLPQYLRDQFGDLAKDKDTTPEEVQARIAEIIGRFEGVNSVLEMVGLSALDATDAGLRAGDAIVELAGGIEQLQSAVGVYYDQFYSESEKIADSLQNIPDTFAQAGVELPSIRAEYRAMVEDIDVTTAAGQSMFATLMSLAGSADAYYDILEAQAAAAEQAAAEAAAALLQSELNYYDLFTAEAQKTEDALAGVRAQFAALDVSLPDTRDGFVQAIEALDLTTASGRSMYETMLGLASAADGYYDTLEARAAEAAQAQEAVTGEEEGLLDRLRESRIALAEATGDTATVEALRAEILQEERNALYAANRAIHDQIQAVNAQAAAAQAAAEAAAASAEAEQVYYAAFTSAAQQQRDSIAEVTEAFEAAGVVLPASREQFAALVESIDTGTASGQQLRQVLIGLADDADTAYTALEAMRESARSAVDAALSTGQQAVREAQQAVMDAYQDEASGLEGVIDTFERFTESLRDFRGELGDAALEMQAPDRQLAELRRQFESVAAAAAGGDRKAMEDLPEIGGRLAEAAREMSSSREDYLRQLAYLDGATANAEAAAGEQVSVAQQQLDALNAQLAALELAGEAQQSFADAVLQLLQAQMEADRLLSEAERQALSVEMHWLSSALSAPLGAGGAIVAALSAGFDAVDMNTDGLLDQSELRAALVETGLLSEADLPAVAAMLDRNRDGVISAIEAQDALLDVHAVAASRNFAALDTSLDGLLDQAELKSALVDTGLLTGEEFGALFAALDDNRDGVVSAVEASDASIKAVSGILSSGLSAVDTSLDGLLDQAELRAALVDTGLLTGDELGGLIDAIDTNGDGLIDAIEQGNLDLIAQFGQYADDVNAAYRAVLGRDADQAGLDYWARMIDSGAVNLDDLDDALLDGAQGETDQAAATAYANSVVAGAYQSILGREADQASLDYWSSALRSGAISIANLPEVIAAAAVNGAAGSDQAAAGSYIDQLIAAGYQAVFGRAPDAAGEQYWEGLLGSAQIQFEDFQTVLAQSALAGADGDDKIAAGRYLGIPGYAAGGDFGGGLRMVGERGPELEVTGPSRIYNASQTAAMLGGGGDSAAIGRLERAISGLQDGIRSIAKHTMQTARRVEFLERWDYDGMPAVRA